jgi:hypothetical protein
VAVKSSFSEVGLEFMNKKSPTQKIQRVINKNKVGRDLFGRVSIGSSRVPDFEDPETQLRVFREQKLWAAALYPPERLKKIAEEFKIMDGARISALAQFLCEAAQIYLDQKLYVANGPTIFETRQHLENVRKIADDLSAAIASLTDDERDILWRPLLAPELKLPGPIAGRLNTIPNLISSYDEHGFPVAIQPARALVTESPALISAFASEALEALPTDRGGRPSTELALHNWTVNAQTFWEKGLLRKFTFDSHQGQGITDAFRFCQAAIAPVDPGVTGQSLATAMRNCIRLTRKGRRPGR